jgi:hypothetical protein
VSRRKYITAAGAVLKQFAKAPVDIFAVLSELDYRVLRHRARPLPEHDLERWGEVWGETEGGAGRWKVFQKIASPAEGG